MLRRTLGALVVAVLIGILGVIPNSEQPALGAEGLVGAVGCSQTRDVFSGTAAIGADGYWTGSAVANYGGGAIYEWADLTSEYWTYFRNGLAANPSTTDIWIELCVKDPGSSTPSAADITAAESIATQVTELAPNVTLHISPMNSYSGIVCPFTGTGGPLVSQALADHLVEQGFGLAGPIVGPLDASTVDSDGCHANEAGEILQAQQLEAYFTGSYPPPPPPTTPTTPTTPPGTTPDPDAPFVDIGGSVFVEDIIWLAKQGITSGCNPPVNDLFCPDTEVTREQMATFLSRAIDLPATQLDLFWDDASSLHEAAINSIGVAEITLGCNPPSNDEYCPDAKVSRGQMASFLVRAYGLPEAKLDLFVDDTGSVYEADINALGRSGVTTGCNPPIDDLFCPSNTVTRGQMAAFLHRASTFKR